MPGITFGIDGSRNRSGGAIAHIVGILSCTDPRQFGISTIHFWAHDALLSAVGDMPWLVKHRVPVSTSNLLRQIVWQRHALPRIARELGVQVLFNTDAGSVCPFQPSVTLSQDMLSFEPGEIQRYPLLSRARMRLEVLRVIQLHRLRRSTASIFLSHHAATTIGSLVPLSNKTVIPHGISPVFFEVAQKRRAFGYTGNITCLYVSNAAPYKHQWSVVEAVSKLRHKLNLDIKLRLVGGGSGAANKRLSASIMKYDPEGSFVQRIEFIPNSQIPDELAAADLFVFASSCENLPITLLEAMASGIPIACSDRGPMPEVLGDDAIYFDPEEPDSIASALHQLIEDPNLRDATSSKARQLAASYTWERCASSTWELLAAVARKEIT